MSRFIALVAALVLVGMGCGKIVGLRTARDVTTTTPDTVVDGTADANVSVPPAPPPEPSSNGSDGRDGSGGSAPDTATDTLPADRAPDSVSDVPVMRDGPPPDVPPSCQVEPARLGVAFKSGLVPTSGMGICSLPPARLSTTRLYGALDTRLLTPEIACGACIEVSDASRSVVIVVEIIDLIGIAVPPGKYALGLEDKAHARFGSGNPDVSFRYVDCPENGNIRTTFDSTTSTNTIVLIMNQRRRFSRVQVLTATGPRGLTQLADHRWRVPGSISEINNDLLFFDNFGRSVLGQRVPFVGEYQDTGAQFPPCP